MNKEFRTFNNTIEQRAADSRSVSGYAVVFNSESRDLGFFETIAPGAITEDTILESDVFATLNHDADKVLGRSRFGQGSLELDMMHQTMTLEILFLNTLTEVTLQMHHLLSQLQMSQMLKDGRREMVQYIEQFIRLTACMTYQMYGQVLMQRLLHIETNQKIMISI